MARKNYNSKRLNKIIFSSIFLLIVATLAILVYINILDFEKEKTVVFASNASNLTEERFVKIYVPAVDNEGKGVATILKVGIKRGDGKILVDINNILFWIDTQQSIQTAKKVAQDITKVDLSKFDLVYSLENLNASVVGGPSAGAALTIATIAAIENKTLNPKVMITGTINPDGTIGAVGGIIPKAQAAKEVGATMLLVPVGQGTQINYVPEEKCEKIEFFTFCTIIYKKKVEDVGKSVGIKVVEVKDVIDALKYFYSEF
ncbi:MAG: S16 family serine protease [Candidatus Aenigmarchaeota archaeon]|jgi:uncharacterized protein|nr:S16 family serine protease [Candidatus Aenigmarchaeota archaeon]